MSLINPISEKQETIKRMINRQYDQLLEMCEKSASEIDYIKQNLLSTDSDQQLEIEKTQELINSIVNDINLKKKEMQSLEVKNRYDQLLSLYQQTQDEVQMLEADLEKNQQAPRKNQLKIFAQTQASEGLGNDYKKSEAFVVPDYFEQKPTQFGQEKRRRLNLSTAAPMTEEERHEMMMDKWHETLAQIDEFEAEKMIEDFILPPSPMDEEIMEDEIVLFELPVAPEIEMDSGIVAEVEKEEENSLKSKKKAQKTKRKRFGGLSVLLNVTFYLVLMCAIFFAFIFGMDNHNHNDATSNGFPRMFFGHSVMRVATGSMSPSLRIDTVIVTKQVEPSELNIGNIVTVLTDEGRIVTHRVYHIYENYQNQDYGFRLIGDANNGVADDIVYPADRLIGRVIFHNYPIGRTLMFIHRHFLTIMLVLGISFVMLLVAKIRVKSKIKT